MAAVRNVNKLYVVRCLSLYLRVDVDPVAGKEKGRVRVILGDIFLDSRLFRIYSDNLSYLYLN